jgi:amphiphysin
VLGHRTSLKKLQDKKEKTLKDEKALYAAENALEVSTQDYNYFNDMLKEELPALFALEAEFIRPLFQNFYYMQLNIFYTLNEKMKNMEIDYFDFTVDIEEQYESKRGDVKERAEELSIVHFKGTGRKRTPPPTPTPSQTYRANLLSQHIRRKIQIRIRTRSRS